MSSNGNGNTHDRTTDSVLQKLMDIRAQQYSALVETERAIEQINPSFTRRFLTRSERRQLRGERRSVYDGQ